MCYTIVKIFSVGWECRECFPIVTFCKTRVSQNIVFEHIVNNKVWFCIKYFYFITANTVKILTCYVWRKYYISSWRMPCRICCAFLWPFLFNGDLTWNSFICNYRAASFATCMKNPCIRVVFTKIVAIDAATIILVICYYRLFVKVGYVALIYTHSFP